MRSDKREDRRVIYTKKVIRDSFLQLLNEKPVEKISVTEICKNADINRGTFYAHYSDPYDLKLKLSQEIVGIISERTAEYVDPDAETRDPIKMMQVLQDNKELCKIFAAPHGDFGTLIDIIDQQMERHLDRLVAPLTELQGEHMSCLRMMSTAAIAAIVKYWMDNDLSMAPEEVMELMSKFIHSGLSAFAPLEEK